MIYSGRHFVPVYTPTNTFPFEPLLCLKLRNTLTFVVKAQCDNIIIITEYIYVKRLVTILHICTFTTMYVRAMHYFFWKNKYLGIPANCSDSQII